MTSAEARRRAYLKALEIDVYTMRGHGLPDGSQDSTDADPSDSGAPDWGELRQQVAACTRCVLHRTRTQTVFGVGNQLADWMIIGEAPGAEEDRRGEPFVGRAGKLLDEMLRAVNLSRDSVFIANILKCRPPNNRDPANDEATSCRSHLDRQIELVSPKIILAVGRIAAQRLLNTDAPLGNLRGQKHQLGTGRIPVIVTYHPAYLLRSPTQKRKAWQDLCLARQVMEELRE
ncbi:MAG: uracil-DNA glycosylase [Proteobacteria bacterium]|nr:uracil-DNA glycosylase [Pseudomonadota bacterium]MDA0992900.1 uracil-DNA glycosylase [Pseudomonadota bacterium]